MAGLKPYLEKIASGETLNERDSARAFEILMTGGATHAQIGAFLMGLRQRGETVEEIAGAAKVMRKNARRVKAPKNAIDTCGTGGDAKGTFNISTACAIVLAGGGVSVAKHGNRAMSSRSGSADVLRELGVNIEADLKTVEREITEAGIGFLMAPRHHETMRYVGAVRVEMGLRTVFNLLGPLANPAGTKRQVIGVFDRKWVRPMAEVLKRLGAQRAWVVHGSDGLDEITTTGKTYVAELKDKRVRCFTITPAMAGVKKARPRNLLGGDAKDNAKMLLKILDGKKGPLRDIVILNAAAAFLVAGKARNLKDGARMAGQSIDSGRAKKALERLIAVSQEKGQA